MISVNRVRNTVMAILQKANRGFLSPMDFDTFCHLAQMDLFENLFYRYNKWVNNANKRYSNSEFADIPKNIKEQIDVFSEYSTTGNFTYDIAADLWGYTGSDLYRTGGLSLKNAQNKSVDLEEVAKGTELNKLINSTINAPSTTYPIYTKLGEAYRVYPKVPAGYSLELLYTRTPKAPKWSYVMDAGGNPQYSGGASDRQDFELDEAIFPLLVVKILAYAGLSISSAEVAQIASAEESETEQKQS